MENIESFLDKKPEGFLIVGIGASAGGVQALKEFFQHIPADSGIAYVVILHLSPDHDSQLTHVLQGETVLPVIKVTEKVKVEPDHVYVVPPNQHLVIEDNFIVPLANMKIEDRRAPVDIFFRHLADAFGPRAVAVILSGTGANGSMGMKRIKELGGVALVQNPREAEFNEMPRSSIITELVDQVLPVAEIPAAIIAYRNNIGTVHINVETEYRPDEQQRALQEIFSQLRTKTGHDFSNYKRPTLLRRIERRINIHNLPDLPAYCNVLQQNPDETNALLKDLLISVTNFFRDKKAFQTIEQDVLPAIFHKKEADSHVRVWVAGCATGEEAYSIAMLIAERTLDAVDAPNVQIFATDIDEAAISIGREGLYTINDAADVSPERLHRFFNKEEDGYRVRREIREMVLFANHNFLKDPPFSRLDLITCRNVLIYLNNTAQERVMETFHFALRSGGYLFLGNSESVDGASDLYASFSRDNHIYQAREVSNRNYPVAESVPKFLFPDFTRKTTLEKEARTPTSTSFVQLHQKLLEEYAAPSVVIDEEYDIIHMSERVGKYFEFTAGEPTQNLLKLVRSEIRLELRSALYRAVQRQTAVEARNVKINIDGQIQFISLQIRPVLDNVSTSNGFILVIFEPNEDVKDAAPLMFSTDEPVAKQLDEELTRLKAQLRYSNEEHEYQAEELKAANEELQAMNEELRSSSEELETSKEELQSINEELRTVNQELKVKIDETSESRNNLQNLINSADVGTIFLDRSFCIRMFTPAIREIFNLIPSDYGRPISDITSSLDYADLSKDAEAVLEKLTSVEREVRTTDNYYFMMRILPYRTAEDRINGVVVTFFSINRRKKAELALRQSEERLRLLIESANDYAIFTLDLERKVTSWSSGATALLGYGEQEMIGGMGDIVFTLEDRQKHVPEAEAETAEKEGRAKNERWHLRKDGSVFWGSGSASPLRDNDGKLIGYVKILRDLTEQKQAQEALRESEERKSFLLQLADSLRYGNPVAIQEWVTSIAMNYFGCDRCYYCEVEDDRSIIRRDSARAGLPSVAGTYSLSDIPIFKSVIDLGRPFIVNDVKTSNLVDEPLRQVCIALQVVSFIDVPVIKDGKAVGILCVVQTSPRTWTKLEIELAEEVAERTWAAVERAKAEEAVQESEAKYRTLFQSIDEGFALIEFLSDSESRSLDFRFVEVNESFEWQTGTQNVTGKLGSEINPGVDGVWIETFGEVARTGEPRRVETYHQKTSRWYDVFATRVGDTENRQVCVIFQNITERKQREANLALLADLSEDFARLTSEVEIMKSIGKRLAKHLRLDGITFSEVDEERESVTVKYNWNATDVPQIVGTFRFAEYVTEEFADTMRAGKIWVVEDTQHDGRTDARAMAAISVGAIVNVPYFRHGEWEGYFTAMSREPRNWTTEEIDLIKEVSSRTFPRLERARAEEALRLSEERRQLALTAADLGTFVWHIDEDRTEADQRALAHFGLSPDAQSTLSDSLARLIHPEDGPGYVKAIETAIDPAGSGTLHQEFRISRADGQRWMSVIAKTLFEGSPPVARRISGMLADITERKIAEEALQQSEERKTQLLILTDTLRSIENPLQVLEEGLKRVGEYLDLDRVVYNEIDPEVTRYTTRVNYLKPGFSSVVGSIPMAPFRETVRDLEKGITYIQPDVERDNNLTEAEKQVCRNIRVQAFVTVPLVKKGRWVCNLVSHCGKPRNWTEHDLTFMKEAADRIWSAFERAKAEQALRESEERLQLATGAAKIGTYMYYPLEDRSESDEQMLALFGLPLHGTLSLAEAMAHIIHVDDRERHVKEVIAAINPAGNGKLDMEFRVVHPDGSLRWLHVTAQAYFEGAPPQPTRMPGVAIDITERKKAEEAVAADLRDTQILQKLSEHLVSEDNSDVIYQHLMDAAITLTAADAGTVQILDEESSDLVLLASNGFPKYVTDYFAHVDARSNNSCSLALVSKQRTFVDFDVPEEQDPDGSLRLHVDAGYLSAQSTPLVSRSGKTIGMVSTHWRDHHHRPTERQLRFLDLLARQAADLIEQRQSKKAMRESERRLRILADAVPQVIWSNDAEGKANFFNQRWYEYSGLSYEESFGVGWEAIVHPDDAPASLEKWNQSLAEGKIFDTEYRLRNAAGKYCWFIGRNVPLKDEAGKVTGWFGSATDIQELKQAEESLILSEARLKITMESATDYAIITMDTERRVERWSSGASQIFGYMEAEIIGQSVDIIFT